MLETPKNTTFDKHDLTAEEYFKLANDSNYAIYKTRDFYNATLGALVNVNKAIALNPNYTDAYLLRSSIYNNLGNFSVAFDEADAVIVRFGNNSEAYASRCVNHYSSSKAIRDCDTAIALDPNESNYYSYRAWKKADLVDHQGGIADTNYAISLAPNDTFNYFVRCQVKTWRRNSISFSKEYLTAMPDCEIANSERPYDPNRWITMGLNMAMLHNHTGAIEYAKKALDLYSDYENQTGVEWGEYKAIAYHNIGASLLALKDYNEALKYLTKAIEVQDASQFDPIYARAPNTFFGRGVNETIALYYWRKGIAEYRLGDNVSAQKDIDYANILDKSLDDYVEMRGNLDSGWAPYYEVPYYID